MGIFPVLKNPIIFIPIKKLQLDLMGGRGFFFVRGVFEKLLSTKSMMSMGVKVKDHLKRWRGGEGSSVRMKIIVYIKSILCIQRTSKNRLWEV